MPLQMQQRQLCVVIPAQAEIPFRLSKLSTGPFCDTVQSGVHVLYPRMRGDDRSSFAMTMGEGFE
ncbi:MAG: hypothetical protein LHV69_06020 [Elusimicrobia bacterium]|nr:hypothetical protein [Candidatus Obscuribacterium magneticum]